MKRSTLRLASLILIGMILLSFIINKDISAKSASLNVPLDTRSLAMINKPGVVLVQTVWTADLTLYEFSFESQFEDDLADAVSSMVVDGTIANTEQAMYSAMVQLMIEYMGDYAFTTGNVSTETVNTAAVGTGFIVTPDGYLITNAHVVATDEDELYLNFAMTALEDYAVEGTNSFVAEMKNLGYQMTKDEIDGLMNAFYYLLADHINIDNLQTGYKCFLGNVSPGNDVSAKAIGLDLRKMGTPIPGKDVAILKIDKTNLPTVILGDDSKIRTGDKVYAMGYPAVATLDDTLNVAQAIQEPTLTGGIISARKEMAGGWNIFQTDAAIHGGNSGGPLFNDAGEVIGINTFSMLDPNSGAQVAGMNFAVPISIAKQFLNEINVTPSESQYTAQYKKAIALSKEKKYDEALEILRGLNETNPGYPVVADLLSETRALADAQPKTEPKSETKVEPKKEDSSPIKSNTSKFPDTIIIVAIAGGVVVIGLMVVIIITSKRRKKTEPKLENINPPKLNIPTALSPNNRSCPGCGKTVDSDSKFCNHCGYAFPAQPAIPDKCRKCNQPVQPGSVFCSGCGAKLTD